MTLQELSEAIGAFLPNASFGDDLDGQLVIYTNLKFDEDENLVDMDEMEEQ